MSSDRNSAQTYYGIYRNYWTMLFFWQSLIQQLKRSHQEFSFFPHFSSFLSKWLVHLFLLSPSLTEQLGGELHTEIAGCS